MSSSYSYSQGPNTLEVSMELFALNRRRLTDKLRKADNTPAKSFVVQLERRDNLPNPVTSLQN